MAEIIKGKFPERLPRRATETGEATTAALIGKQSGMLLFFSRLRKTDPSASYDKVSADLRQATFKDWSDDALKDKMLSGSDLEWKKDPQWWYALEQEMQDRMLVPRWRR